ncbi:MAG: DUF2029 domain-containing protein, partial [Chitinophagaceae bacterium]
MDLRRVGRFFSSGAFLYDRLFALAAWFGLSLFAVLKADLSGNINNYKIYRHVFVHLREQQNLFNFYPGLYEDQNLYGPVFGVLIAPFAVLPDAIGVVLWVLFNVAILFYAIRKLPLPRKPQWALLVLCSHELMNASSWLQINALVCACI